MQDGDRVICLRSSFLQKSATASTATGSLHVFLFADHLWKLFAVRRLCEKSLISEVLT